MNVTAKIQEVYTDGIMFLYVDLFCGAGGTSTGVEKARLKNMKIAKVIACVNHDENAIASHAANHPGAKHYTEDVRTLDLTELVAHIALMRQIYRNAKIVLWISAECTSHSNAKGGTSRDADSRSLPEEMYRYIKAINPDIIQVENVKEFLDWGPLIIKVVRDKKTKEELYCPLDIKREKKKRGQKQGICIRPTWMPDPRFKKNYYNRWVNEIKSYGYQYDYRVPNAADYGAYTSRKRYFGIFAKEKKYIVFPKPTHSKDGKNLPKWKAVKEVLDFTEMGVSLFGRKKDLSEKTLARIYSGLIVFVAGGKENFLIKWNSMQQNGNYIAPSVDDPCPTITCQNRLGIANVRFLSKYFSGHPESKNISVDGPAHTIRCKDSHSLISCSFLAAYYGNGANVTSIRMIDQQYGQSKPASIDNPIGAIMKNPKFNLVEAKWIMNSNFNSVGHSIESPAPTICASRRHHYLMNPQYQSAGSDINNPCFTLIARMDKKPPHLVSTVEGAAVIMIYESDSPMTKKIKEFMVMYGIADILMRMLLIRELKSIMGFPKGYKLIGTQTEQKKYIGNAVEVNMAMAMCTAIGEVELEELMNVS
ncbi:MAG: DNA cytosine methyltransferase [Tannerella sp.]|jgi:DNA (cytosine-5)-methyltransferase 1|nr:DNA cytosine methyltransferase [Tannerella sp.]